MICGRAVSCLLAAYAAGADDPAVDQVAAAIGVDRIDLSLWRMQARASIAAQQRDWQLLVEARVWREQRSLHLIAGAATALSEMG